MKWPTIPFDRDLLNNDLPKEIFKVIKSEEVIGVSSFERENGFIKMKYTGLKSLLNDNENRISFYAENPFYYMDFDGRSFLEKIEIHNNSKVSHIYQEFILYDPITVIKRVDIRDIESDYLYFEIFNMLNGFDMQGLEKKILRLKISEKEILVMPNKSFSLGNMSINAIGAIKLDDNIEELETIIQKALLRASLFFMNFVEIGSLIWLENQEGRIYKHTKLVPYRIRQNVSRYNTCYEFNRRGDIAFSEQCRNVVGIEEVLSDFIRGLEDVDDFDIAFLKENIASAKGETSLEYMIVKYAVAMEKLHSLLGRKLGINCSPVTASCVESIYNKLSILNSWYAIQEKIYNLRSDIAHGNIEEYKKKIDQAYETVNKVPKLISLLLGVLSGLKCSP